MKIINNLVLLFFLAISFSSCNHSSGLEQPLDRINTYYVDQIDSLTQSVDKLLRAVEADRGEKDIQEAFAKSRIYWKHIEPLTEYYFANVSEFINGPALPEEEDYDAKIIEPSGFQVIEEFIFPVYDTTAREDLLQEIKVLQSAMGRLHQLFESNTLSDVNVFEASRLELLRIISLGISGFDSPIAMHSVEECRHALTGLYILLNAYSDKAETKELLSLFAAADKFLLQQKDFDTFDRATFIQQHIIPISEAIYNYQQELKIANNKWITAVDLSKTNLADASIMNTMYFSPSYTQTLDPRKEMIELGRTLFFDPVLSGNNSRSCASCHRPEKAFTDGQVKSKAFASQGEVFRNAPTLINSGFQKAQFADSRVSFLEDQITDVMHNPTEMHGSMKEAVKKIQLSSEYQSMFSAAFPGVDTIQRVTGKQIQIALASYIRSLNGLNSKFDQFIRGSASLNSDEIHGFNLFMGKGKCGTCHFMPLFNGSVPPMYVETESEVLGVPLTTDTLHAKLDPDDGKILVSKKSVQKNMFKTPTVRNVALTAPYMHNGVFSTLDEVMDFYNRGGGAGIGIDLENQTLPPDPLKLTSSEKQSIIAFMRTLTDTTGLGVKPTALPKTDDPKLDQRKIGGDY